MEQVQATLDKFEQDVLTDIFGGYTADKFVVKYGFFRYDFADKVQKVIQDFETLVKPLMDEQGKIDPSIVNKYLPTQLAIVDPYARVSLDELYQKVRPLVLSLGKYIKG